MLHLLSHSLSTLDWSDWSHQWSPICSYSILITVRAMNLVMIMLLIHAILLLLHLHSSLSVSVHHYLNIINLLNAFFFAGYKFIDQQVLSY